MNSLSEGPRLRTSLSGKEDAKDNAIDPLGSLRIKPWRDMSKKEENRKH